MPSDEGNSGKIPCTLLVGGQLDEKDLAAFFSEFDFMKSDANNRRRHLARVTLGSLDSARRAVEALDGRDGLSVSFQIGRRDKLFPLLPFSKRVQMRVGPVASFSMTDEYKAMEMTGIMAQVAREIWRVDPDEATQLLPLTVTDATACSGGNTMSLASTFKTINVVEIDADIYSDLVHNLSVLEISPDRLSLHNRDFLEIGFTTLHQHIVFIDPPWNDSKGPGYISDRQSNASQYLKLGSMDITEVLARLLSPSLDPALDNLSSKELTRLVALKLPTRGTDCNAVYREVMRIIRKLLSNIDGDRLWNASSDYDMIPFQISGVSIRFGRSLLLLIATGMPKEEMRQLMKQIRQCHTGMNHSYELLK